MKLKYLFFWLLTICLIIIGSLTPSLAPPVHNNEDKILHFLAYFAITIPPIYYLTKWWARLITAIALISVGITIEALQSNIEGRTGSLDDIIANSLGVVAGIIITILYIKYKNLNPNK